MNCVSLGRACTVLPPVSEGTVTLILLQDLVVAIHRRAAFRSVGLRRVVMAASHEITHEIMHHLAVWSDAGGRYSERICSSNLSNPGLWLFLGIYDEPQELCFWTCTASVA